MTLPQADITVQGHEVPSDELLERLADLLVDLSDESPEQGGTYVREAATCRHAVRVFLTEGSRNESS